MAKGQGCSTRDAQSKAFRRAGIMRAKPPREYRRSRDQPLDCETAPNEDPLPERGERLM
jgi:hypothetical protein